MDETDVNLPNTMKNFINQFLRIMGTLIIVAYTLPLVIFAIFPLAVGVIMILKTYIKTSRMLRRSGYSEKFRYEVILDAQKGYEKMDR